MLIDDQKPAIVTTPPPATQLYADPPPYEPAQRTRSISSTSYAAQHAPTPMTRPPPAAPSSASSYAHDDHDDLPPSFSRLPPAHHTYPSFAPVFLIARGRYLNKGFPVCPPPASAHPHPFITHDVNESDWTRLLDEIRRSAMLTQRDIRLAQSVPIVNRLPIVGGLIEHAIKQHFKKRKAGPVSTIIETWNHHFFRPRRMEVILMYGEARLSGDGPVPDADVFRSKPRLNHEHEHESSHHHRAGALPSASTSASSLSEMTRGADGAQQRGSRQARLPQRRGEEKKEKTDKTYRLFVVAAP